MHICIPCCVLGLKGSAGMQECGPWNERCKPSQDAAVLSLRAELSTPPSHDLTPARQSAPDPLARSESAPRPVMTAGEQGQPREHLMKCLIEM